MDMNNFLQSKFFKIILASLLGLVIFLLIFSLGLMVGFRKANFSYKWGENYHQNFAGPRGGFMKIITDIPGRDFISGHGIFGPIIDIASSTLVVMGQGEAEKVIAVDEKTMIKRFDKDINFNDLKIDDNIVVIGEPNEAGQIEAKLIRVMPIELPMFVPRQFMGTYF